MKLSMGKILRGMNPRGGGGEQRAKSKKDPLFFDKYLT